MLLLGVSQRIHFGMAATFDFGAMDASREWDVLVAGGGNAALCAAITAREAGLTVLMVECAPEAMRGGNSRHTRNMRTMHSGPLPPLTGAYPEQEYWEDLLKVTGGLTDEKLARMTIPDAHPCENWIINNSQRHHAA